MSLKISNRSSIYYEIVFADESYLKILSFNIGDINEINNFLNKIFEVLNKCMELNIHKIVINNISSKTKSYIYLYILGLIVNNQTSTFNLTTDMINILKERFNDEDIDKIKSIINENYNTKHSNITLFTV